MRNLSKTLFLALSVMMIALISGCGSSQSIQTDQSLVWPPPPDTARIKYVKTYRGEEDFPSGLSQLLNVVGGKSSTRDLQRPFDVCTDNADHIYVSDLELGVISFDLKKNEVTSLTDKPSIPLGGARGLAYDNNQLFVGLVDLGQVAVITTDGQLVKMIGRKGQFGNPVDVVCDTTKHRILIVDNKLHKIFIYSENGDSLFTVGKRGTDDGEFNMPQAAAVDGNSNIYVDDAFNFRIEIFDSTGTFLRKFGDQGEVYGTFARPKGIALDSFGHIYVLDASHQNYQVFDQQGNLLLFVGKFSSGNDGFQNPVSLFIDRSNMIYVTDQLNQRVQIFQLLKGN